MECTRKTSPLRCIRSRPIPVTASCVFFCSQEWCWLGYSASRNVNSIVGSKLWNVAAVYTTLFVIISLLLSVRKGVVRLLSSRSSRGVQFCGPKNDERCNTKQFFQTSVDAKLMKKLSVLYGTTSSITVFIGTRQLNVFLARWNQFTQSRPVYFISILACIVLRYTD
jgi:hypothetical protein